MRLRSINLVHVVLMAAAMAGCAQRHDSANEVTDTNTNWLVACDADSTCGALSCLCGRCTISCERTSECARFGEAAACEQPATSECSSRALCVLADATASTSHSGLDAACTDSDCGVASSEARGSDSKPSLSTTGEASSVATLSSTDSANASTVSAPNDSLSSAPPDASTLETTAAESTASTDDCAEAIDEGPCSDEGASCGGPCTDECQFCNLLRCSGGQWQRLEAFPAPCVECGDALDCNTLDSYCHVVDGATYSCESYPAACSDDHTCACLEAQVEGVCSDQDSKVTVASGTSVVDQCSCTVWLSGSGWCQDITGPDGGAFSVEWVCGAQTEVNALLNAECEVMPTGAERWCCPASFQPTCQ